jgi:hypothetical protein
MFRTVLLGLVTLLLTINIEATVRVEKIEYRGWKNCYRVAHCEIELIVTGEVGPRIIIRMTPSGTGAKVLHRITNHSLFPLECAPWALTMMAQGGIARDVDRARLGRLS